MDIVHAIILSIVEGVTEFLPISSTGHLIIASSILNISQTSFVKDFEIIIQLGAILAIVVLYFQRFLQGSLIWKKILVAFLPTAVIGFVLFKFIKSFLLGNLYVTLLSLLIGGIALIVLELIHKEKESHYGNIEEIPYSKAFIIGCSQAIAVIPGVSRSAATIVSALFLGTKRKTAAEFSFLLAVPTMLAASGLDLVKSNFHYSSSEWIMLIIGFIVSFITAIFVVKWFVKIIQSHTFIPFGVYRIVIAILFWYILLK